MHLVLLENPIPFLQPFLSDKLISAMSQFCCQSFQLKINLTWGKYRGCFRYTVYENASCLTAILTSSIKFITRVVDTL